MTAFIRLWNFMTRRWAVVYGLSLAVLLALSVLGVAYPGLANSSELDLPLGKTLLYTYAFPGNLLLAALPCSMLGLFGGVIFFAGYSEKILHILLLAVISAAVVLAGLVFTGPWLAGTFEFEHVDSLSSGGRSYQLARPAVGSLGPTSFVLLECGRLGVVCKVVHKTDRADISCYNFSSLGCGVELSENQGMISLMYRGEAVDTYQPD